MARKNCSNIGGQAVLEGVMMRGSSVSATAVRDPYGNIQVESERFEPLAKKSWIFRVPIIRGVCNFVVSMISGTKTLMRATEVYGDDMQDEPTKFDLWIAKTFKIDAVKLAGGIGLVLGLLLAVALFVLLPTYATKGLYMLIDLSSLGEFWRNFIPSLTQGVIKILIFVAYISLASQMKEIKRLFRYHGAEHKVISCYEHGLELTVENAQKMTTVHDRCGTTFVVIVMVVSILFFSLFKWHEVAIFNALIRIAFLPLIAGISYEFLKLFAKFDNIFVKICKAPGLLFQKLTTKEPDDSMVEVAIVAFKTVMAMEENPDMPTSKFTTFFTLEKVYEDLKPVCDNENNVNLVLMNVTGTNNLNELKELKKIPSTTFEKAKEILTKVKESGMPLQYAMGSTNFYGYDFKVNESVLIPRFDTEILAEKVINLAKGYENPQILELCTGSGAVAITVKLNTNATVVATDISADALSVARENSEKLHAEVEFIEGDLFNAVMGRKFDIIVANPPYIPSKDIETLDKEVKDFEPMLALDGGEDGLNFYRKIALEYKNYLNEGGAVALEVGIGEAQAVSELFDGEIEIIKDYNEPQIERVVVIK